MNGIIYAGTRHQGDNVAPMVHLAMRYACPSCPALHVGYAQALADSGASHSTIPRRMLPAGVPWDSLEPSGNTVGITGEADLRRWAVELVVHGVTIGASLDVLDLMTPGLPWVGLGTDTLFRAFDVRFAWGNDPPAFVLEPRQGVTVPRPVMDLTDLPLVEWIGEGQHVAIAEDVA